MPWIRRPCQMQSDEPEGIVIMAVKSSDALMVQRRGDVHVVEFLEASVLDQMRVEQIRAALLHLVEQAAVPKLVISFENVQHISSAMLGVLISVHNKAKPKAGGVRLSCVPASVLEVLKITNLHKLMSIYTNTELAMIKF